MEPRNETSNAAPEAHAERKGRFFARRASREPSSGQAIVEFAIVSVAFFMVVFGTVDLGRAIYMYSQLHNAVQEGARYGKTHPIDSSGIQDTVIDSASSFDLTSDDVTVTCRGTDDGVVDCTSCAKVQVDASAQFSAITQDFLGISPITLNATAKVATE
jgi:Flp pilus assembly protein TadG